LIRAVDDALRIDPAKVERAIVKFIRERVRAAGATGTVLGMSGGLDSSVTAHLCVRAMGKSRVWPLFLPEGELTPSEDKRDVTFVCRQLGLRTVVVDIAPIVERFRSVLSPNLIALANLKARVRMCILYYHANSRGALVVGTGNRSELRTGYFTKYGDGGCDLLPLGALYKTQVKVLAQYLGLPERIIEKTPSARLWPGQTDESELGLPYDELDRVLVALDLGYKPSQIARGLDLPINRVRAIVRREAQNRHKLLPPAVPEL
jgi:NAD+ synthase